MEKIINAGHPDYNRLHFEWFLVNWCNYKCSYCSSAEVMVDTYSKTTSPGKYKLVLQRLAALDNEFEMDLFGGEPTLHPNFLNIIEELSILDNCKLIEIKTNLSKSLQFFKKVFRSNKVKLSASYHAEYYDQKFLDKCVALKDYNFYCHINLSDKPEHWPQILEMISYFDTHGVRYDLNLLWSTPGNTINYSQEFFDIFQPLIQNVADTKTYRFGYNNGTEEYLPTFIAFKEKMNRFKGKQCKALLYEILEDGTIVNGCTRKRAPLLLKQETLCVKVTCPRDACHADFMLNFYKDNV